jgi:hypothetical protein
VGLSVLGSAVGMAADGLSDLAKAGIQFMIKETQKSIETFRTMSQSGALFSDGAVGMRKAATDAGMTLQDFSKVTSQNKEVFAKLGMGVTGGIQRMSGAMKAGGTEMQEQLFALGYSMEDQGNLVAQTMSAMADPSGRLKASNEEVAARAKKYAADLALISSLTGEDIKAKQEKIKQENLELAIQQKLAKMTPEDRAKFKAMQESMTDVQRRQLKERMVYGSTVSSDLAIMEATSSAFKESGDAFASSVNDGTMSARKGLEIRAEYDQKAADQFGEQSELAMGAMHDASSAAGQAAKGMSQSIAEGGKVTKEGIEAAEQALKDRAKQAPTDPMVGVQKAANDFSKELEALATGKLSAFGGALKTTMTQITDAVNAADKALKGTSMPSPWIAGIMALGTTLLQFLPALIMAMKGGGGGGPEIPDVDGKGKPKGPDGKPKSKVGKVFNAAKNLGSKALGFLPGFGTAAEAATVGTTAASSTAAGATSMLGKTAGVALKAAKFLGPAAMIGSAAYDGFKGYQNAGANFDLKPGQEASAGQKASSTAGGVLSGLTFGLLDQKKATQGIHSAGSAVGDFYSNMYGKVASGASSLVKGGMSVAGGAADYLSSKVSGMATGYTPGGGLPKEFVEMQKASQDKLNTSIAQLGTQMKDSNKYGPETVEVLRAQITKQDELIAIMKESLDINQRLLTQAQG